MTALQFAIGALNDVVDAPADAGRVPPKPIPGGLVAARTGLLVATIAAIVGLALAVPSGPALVLLGGVVLAIGAVYDLVAKGTPWSWVPFAVGIPILPVFGWYGAAGALPGFFVVLVPMAVLAGAGLAIANARVDVEDDTRAGVASVATALGPDRAWWINAALMAAATGLGIVFVGRASWAPLTGRCHRDRHCARLARPVGRSRSGGGCPASRLGGAGDRCRDRGGRLDLGDAARRVAGTAQSEISPVRTIAIAFSRRSFAIVRYFARLARSTSGICSTTSGVRSTLTRSSSASPSDALAFTSESSLSSRRRWGRTGSGSGASSSSTISTGNSVGVLPSRSTSTTISARAHPRPATLDLVAQLDERQLAASDLFGEAPASLRVLDLEQLVRVRQRVFAHRHQGTDLVRGVGQPEPVLEITLVLAELVGELADAVAVFADHPVVHRRFIEWRDVLALEVLDDRDLERGVVVDLLDQRRDRQQAGDLGRAPAALAGDQLVAVRSDWADEDRLEDAVLADRGGELVERLLVEGEPGLRGVRLDVIDRNDPDADAARRAVRGQQADDDGGELALLGEAPRGCRAEISSRQGPPPLVRAHDMSARLRCRRHTS